MLMACIRTFLVISILAISVLTLAPAASLAQTVQFPLAASDARTAAARFDQRSAMVIWSSACASEVELAHRRSEMAQGNFENQGEGLGHILIAKLAWLNRTAATRQPCVAPLVIEEVKKDDDKETLQGFQNRWIGMLGCAISANPPVNATSKVEPGRRIFKIEVTANVTHNCMKSQINSGILAMRKTARMGTSTDDTKFIPCLGAGSFSSPGGEFDTNVRELVRILYMGTTLASNTDVLDPPTVEHMYKHLLAARGSVGPARFNVVSDCDDTAGEHLGLPGEYADRQDLGSDILDALGDALEWAAVTAAKVAIVAAAATVIPLPFLLIIPALGLNDPIGLIEGAGFDLSIPETENHRLMIESSRYLTNAAIIKALGSHDNLPEIRKQQREVREWLLRTLQHIANNDFDEYNARAYTRYSLEAILNLYDFAGTDTQMRNAARIVLDLSAAKFAAGSNRGRRVAPYRRLAKHDGTGSIRDPFNLYNLGQGTDHEVVRAFVLAGQTQLLETVTSEIPTEVNPFVAERRDPPAIFPNQTGSMVNAAVSSYRPPTPVLETAVERNFPFQQVVKHASMEVYYHTPAFTMSVGGIPAPAALTATVLRLENADDRGIAMPTSLIPTITGTTLHGLFQMEGFGVREERTANICGWKGFICGINPRLWFGSAEEVKRLRLCVTEQPRTNNGGPLFFLSFVNSAFTLEKAEKRDCIPEKNENGVQVRRPGPHFFLAARVETCAGEFCPIGAKFGIMEMVDVPDETAYSEDEFRRFIAERSPALAASVPDRSGVGVYTTRAGEKVKYQITKDRSALLDVNGVLPYAGPAWRSSGDIINTNTGPEGKASIVNPFSGARVDIDFTLWHSPTIKDTPAPPGNASELYKVRQDTAGTVDWFKHGQALAPTPGTTRLRGPLATAVDWSKYSIVTAAVGSPVVYAMEPNGDLYWFRHDGYRAGAADWRRSPDKIGNGWNSFNTIVAGENGVIYGRLPDGRLRWHRHLGHDDGSIRWAEAKIVREAGEGWGNFIRIFAGSNGVLYGILGNGDLMWHQHRDHQSGGPAFTAPKPRVGNGWQEMKAVFSVGQGIIYGVKPGGELTWFRHNGHTDGEFVWAPNQDIAVGWGNFRHVFAFSPQD
jgi:hypothetical protein